MTTYLVDENMPFMPFWDREKFVQVTDIPLIHFDTEIWEYALKNELAIITKDSDFYFRYLSSQKKPKIVWVKTPNLKKKVFIELVEKVWNDIEEMLLSSSFIIITEDKIERF